MTEARLAAGIEVSALIRQAEHLGGFGMVLHRGDAERGTLLISVAERGEPAACLARSMRPDGGYGWERVGPSESGADVLSKWLARRCKNDPDEWQIELDVPSAERFIAETTAAG